MAEGELQAMLAGGAHVADSSDSSPEPTLEEYEALLAARREHLVRVEQPMVLITQAPRSGGTLLLRLFDGHPACHSIPYEFGLYLEDRFPLVEDLDAAWRALHDNALPRRFSRGMGQSHGELHGDRTRYPLLVVPSLHRALYDEHLARIEAPTDRDVFNAYFTGFFNAWLDNHNLYGGKKQWIVVFSSRQIRSAARMSRFRSIYPDGHIVAIVRDPLTWFSSARRWSNNFEWSEPERAVHAWCEWTEALIATKNAQPEATTVIVFEDLLKQTRDTMRALTDRLAIKGLRESLAPTFNQLPIRANSSFHAGKAKVTLDPLSRDKQELTAQEKAFVRKRAWDLYEQALDVASRPR